MKAEDLKIKVRNPHTKSFFEGTIKEFILMLKSRKNVTTAYIYDFKDLKIDLPELDTLRDELEKSQDLTKKYKERYLDQEANIEKIELDEYSRGRADAEFEVEILCSGCDIREPWEHRCAGTGCTCNNPICMEIQGRISWDELTKIVSKDLKGIDKPYSKELKVTDKQYSLADMKKAFEAGDKFRLYLDKNVIGMGYPHDKNIPSSEVVMETMSFEKLFEEK